MAMLLAAVKTTPAITKLIYLKKQNSLIDPWGNPYLYRHPGEHGDYDLYSLGADGQDGGEDEDADLTSW